LKIKNIKSEHRNDFTADIECEHCGHTQHLSCGYHDNYYHTKVIPAITCKACGKNRAGDIAVQNPEGVLSV
jgi:transcription elongation factor Elf1